MSLSRLFPPEYVFHNASGQGPNASGLVYFYDNGTADLATVYTSAAGTTASSNPLTLGSDGRLPNDVFTNQTLRVKVTDSLGAQISQDDDVKPLTDSEQLASIAELTALDVSSLAATLVYVSGYYASGDGGGGWFEYLSGNSDTADGGITFAPDAGSGRWKRVEREEIYVEMFGAKGDGSTDDSAAIIAATGYVDATLVGGVLRFRNATYVFDANKWTLNGVRGVRFVGMGGDAVENGTLLILKNNAADTELLRITACLNLTFEYMRFAIDESTATAATHIVVMDAEDLPVLSNNNIQFNHCNFNPQGAGALTANVWVYDSVHTGFKHCTFSNNPVSVLLGQNSGVNPGTFGNGNCAEATFIQCLFGGDVFHRRGWGFTYIGCHFQQRPDGTGAVIAPSGDQQDRQVNIIGCQWFDGDDTRTAITQGTAGENLVVQSCRFDGVAKGIVLNGKGNAVIEGNFFNGSAITAGIEINNPARNVRESGNDFEALIAAGNQPIDDNTTSGSSAAKFRAWAVNNTNGSDATLTGTGFTGNDFCSSNKSYDGGYHQVNFQVEIVSAETTVYEARFVVDGIAYGQPVKATIPSGETATLNFSQALAIPTGDNKATKIQVKQTANSSASTVKANATFLQCYPTGLSA